MININGKEDKILEMYESGKSITNIWKILGVSQKKVKTFLIEKGIKIRMGNNKVLTKEQDEKILDMFKQGDSVQKIFEKLSIHTSIIRKVLRKNGIEPPKRNFSQLSKEDVKNIIDLYKSGECIKDIAKLYGSCWISVRNLLRDNKIEIKIKNGKKDIPSEAINDYLYNEVSIMDIIAKYKLCKKSTLKYFKSIKRINKIRKDHFFDIWIEKYGKEKYEELKKQYIQRAGDVKNNDRNPMYGKIPKNPNNGSRGIGGYYKGQYLRSLKEISFVIQAELNGKKWESVEQDISIEYEFEGKIWTYHPDFKIDNIIYEIKPKNFINDPRNSAKREAAIKFFSNTDLIYTIIDNPTNMKLIEEKLLCGELKFDEQCEFRFLRLFKQMRNSTRGEYIYK